MESHGFPELWADDEYATYFEKIFGDDKERQRRYLKGISPRKKPRFYRFLYRLPVLADRILSARLDLGDDRKAMICRCLGKDWTISSLL
jgi:hypothetical protein